MTQTLSRSFADVNSAYGCFEDIITLSCAENRTIFVTNAYYGQFLQTCSHEGIACCSPNPVNDCVEDLETNSPADWLVLKTWCDNQTSCEFVNRGGYMGSCADTSRVDYLTVNYQCLPGQTKINVAKVISIRCVFIKIKGNEGRNNIAETELL